MEKYNIKVMGSYDKGITIVDTLDNSISFNINGTTCCGMDEINNFTSYTPNMSSVIRTRLKSRLKRTLRSVINFKKVRANGGMNKIYIATLIKDDPYYDTIREAFIESKLMTLVTESKNPNTGNIVELWVSGKII